MGANVPVTPAVPPRKAVLIGGEADGRIVRLPWAASPAELVVLMADEGDPPAVAFIAPQDNFPAAAAGRPVRYRLEPMVGFPEDSRISAYVPVEVS
jgi:hypothetical protein